MKIQPSLHTGHNRTGIAEAPERHGMVNVPAELGPTSRGSIEQIAAVRNRYTRRGGPPGTMPENLRVSTELLQLLDLLGARMQFERTTVRLYDALIAKRDAFGSYRGGPDRADLMQIRNEELAHMRMLDGMIEELGGDPTCLTPSANREAIGSRGIADVLLDPRTSLLDGLESIALAELADHEQWLGLIELVRAAGRDDLARAFLTAQTTEDEHLSKLRRWISAGRIAARDQAVHS